MNTAATRRVPATRSASGFPWPLPGAGGRAIRVLGALLGVQLLLALVLFWQERRAADFEAPEVLLAAEPASIDTLRIVAGDAGGEGAGDDGGNAAVTLVRDGEGWRIDGDPSLPADTAKVEGALETLVSLEGGLPVATTVGARAQLDVAEDDFQRHIVLGADGEDVAGLYVGTSPGFRKAHVRVTDADAVYAASVNVFDLPADADGWLDRTALAFDGIERIEGADFTLVRGEETWTLADAPGPGRALSEERAAELVAALEGLRVDGVADRHSAALAGEGAADGEADSASEGTGDGTGDEASGTNDGAAAEAVADAPTRVELEITTANGESTLVLERRGDVVVARRSELDAWFTVPADRLDALAGFGRESLTQAVADEGDEGGDDGAAETGDGAAGGDGEEASGGSASSGE